MSNVTGESVGIDLGTSLGAGNSELSMIQFSLKNDPRAAGAGPRHREAGMCDEFADDFLSDDALLSIVIAPPQPSFHLGPQEQQQTNGK